MGDAGHGDHDGLGQRKALILLCGLLVGIISGLLTFAVARQWAVAVLAGGAAVGGAVLFFEWLIKDSQR